MNEHEAVKYALGFLKSHQVTEYPEQGLSRCSGCGRVMCARTAWKHDPDCRLLAAIEVLKKMSGATPPPGVTKLTEERDTARRQMCLAQARRELSELDDQARWDGHPLPPRPENSIESMAFRLATRRWGVLVAGVLFPGVLSPKEE